MCSPRQRINVGYSRLRYPVRSPRQRINRPTPSDSAVSCVFPAPARINRCGGVSTEGVCSPRQRINRSRETLIALLSGVPAPASKP
ncbi:hypothetical protein KCP71_11650 [Salmonella enterica subsp. enterica]|nr:hypothetical protein KCP71_11650 [Salmonella enterica subsp. enterica]